AAIEAVGARVEPLPAFSPDLTPVEELASKAKEYLRSVGARTTQTVMGAVGTALEQITPSDIRGWFQDRCESLALQGRAQRATTCTAGQVHPQPRFGRPPILEIFRRTRE
ncbi:MAG: hypothetical protein JOZ17_07345, partial [Acetobacteraceae bacterium]|nr:hypothetical protein [Acetobacteraceae bacterium]